MFGNDTICLNEHYSQLWKYIHVILFIYKLPLQVLIYLCIYLYDYLNTGLLCVFSKLIIINNYLWISKWKNTDVRIYVRVYELEGDIYLNFYELWMHGRKMREDMKKGFDQLCAPADFQGC